jgi:hypothetical protein
MVGEFRDQHVRQPARPGQPLGDGLARRRHLDDPVAPAAGALRAHMTDDPEAGGDILQEFRHVFTERLKRAAAVRTGRRVRCMDVGLPRQVIGEASRGSRAVVTSASPVSSSSNWSSS